ncbi:MAG: bifunctional GTP diphosphokinase/guanosine-3',5'-bis pyrophosphate 3'-pyrophosphohydrolase [Pseudomonadales bacterium]|nr:bifunctional GTP diphosphokinase/guanosine-3',5'-bis pyrophosphate 3'-pyrophosphohydrolase [Pseudomonadales bacterium]
MVPYFDTIQKKLDYLDPSQIESIKNSLDFAEEAHEGQYRRSGDPYITHPVAVAGILADMHMDHQSLMAALLHDVIEDTDVSKDTIAELFSDEVANLVDGVSKISAIKVENRAVAQAENFRKMMLAMTRDIRVILVKLADRLHNMRTLGSLQPAKRNRIATETLEIYAPIANRLGMNNIRIEFEDLSFCAMYPMRSTLIKKAIKKSRGNRKEIMSGIQDSIDERLKQDKISARVVGREKHLYSIYTKMKSQSKSFSQIMDINGFRIVVNNVDDCYRTLGAVHNLYKPIPGRFKDYIAIPKANGYQSLHTTLKGNTGLPIEIQIRTEDMDAMANDGIAAHSLYKTKDGIGSGTQLRTREWLRELLELQQHAGNSLEFIENVKIDLFPDEVYVFTPKGNILELPTGATPVDFAYAVHTDVGNSCVAARVDNRLAPLSAPIQSGQTVEIITAPGASPNPAWLSFIITGKARSNIRHFLKNQRFSESVSLGRRLLDKALATYSKSLDDITEEQIQLTLTESGFDQLDDLLEDVGLGNRIAPIVAHRLLPAKEVSEFTNKQSVKPLAIRGTEGMLVNFGRCCRPIPGDQVIGFLSSGRGMVIHVNTCRNVREAIKDNPEKCLPVAWDERLDRDFTVELRVELENNRGVLAAIATIIADGDSNIETINMGDKDGSLSTVNLGIIVKNRVHLAGIIKRLRNSKVVSKITRIKG